MGLGASHSDAPSASNELAQVKRELLELRSRVGHSELSWMSCVFAPMVTLALFLLWKNLKLELNLSQQKSNSDAVRLSMAHARTAPPPFYYPENEARIRCIVCFEREKEVVLNPCRHLCCCNVCAGVMHACPLCRSPIESKTNVFIP